MPEPDLMRPHFQEKTPFYTQLAYLLGTCSAFTHASGLNNLKEDNLDSDYMARGPLVPKIRQALGKGKPVVVNDSKTRFEGVPIDINNEAFTKLTLTKESQVDAQGDGQVWLKSKHD